MIPQGNRPVILVTTRGILRVEGRTASGASRTSAGGRRASIVRTSMSAVNVWIVIATRRRPTSVIGILWITRTRGTVFASPTRRRTSVPLAAFVELARRATPAIVVAAATARAVASGGTTSVVVVVVRRRGIAATATSARRARTVPIASAIIGSARPTVGRARLERGRWGRVRHVLGAHDLLALELVAIQLLDSRLQISLRLVLDESVIVSNMPQRSTGSGYKLALCKAHLEGSQHTMLCTRPLCCLAFAAQPVPLG